MRQAPTDAGQQAMSKSRPRQLRVQLSCMTCGPLTLDLTTNLVTKGGVSVKLTPKECELLTAFMRHPGEVLSRELLIQEIWQTDFTDDMRVLHVHIRMLRKKIEDDPNVPQLIQTVRNRGYRFVVPDVERIF